jgi:hypothetical protein
MLLKQRHALQHHRPPLTRELDVQGRVLTGSMVQRTGYNRVNAPSSRFVLMVYGAAL